jgi:hypothetical protein
MFVRVLLGIFVAAHAMGHVSWMIAAFFPGSLEEPVSDQVLGGRADGRSVAAKIVAIASLVAMFFFVMASIGVILAATWWWTAALGGIVVSVGVALAWWNPVGKVSVLALLGDAGILVAGLIPWVAETAGIE